MIESVEELEQVFKGIESNLKELDRLDAEYDSLPFWAIRRQRKNLNRSLEVLEANGPLWAKLNEGLAPGVPATIKTTFTQDGKVIAEGEVSG